MRTVLHFGLPAVYLLFVSLSLSAQTDSRPCPASLLGLTGSAIELLALDVEAAWLRADKEAAEWGKHLYGVVQENAVDLSPEGGVTQHIAAVHVDRAQGVALHFDDFHLPAGAELWVTDVEGTWQEGPYDFRDNDQNVAWP